MRRHLGLGLICAASLIAVGCGGGYGSSGGSPSLSNVARTGTFTLQFSGGSAPGIEHAWLTVYKVAFNADANRPWDPTDATWKVVPLASPVTFDMASAGGLIVGTNTQGIDVPVGTYNQIRLFLSPHDDVTAPMPTVALTSTTSKTLTYRAQLDYSNGAFVPIEIPNVQSGLRLDQGVVIAAGAKSLLTTHIDVDRSIVRFNGGGAVDAITMRPRMYTYGIGADFTIGSIQGAIDPAYVCGTTGARSDCLSDITVGLYAPSRDGVIDSSGHKQPGLRMENWGTVKIDPKMLNPSGTGVLFALGPLSVDPSNSSYVAPASYDLVIRGKNDVTGYGMKTMVVKGIAFGQLADLIGCAWSTATGSADTANAATYIRPVIDGAPRKASLSPALALKSGRVGLAFTLGAGTKPYEVHAANTDPFTGFLTADAALSVPSVAGGDVLVAQYSDIKSACALATHTPPADLAIPFALTPTVEGVGAFKPFSIGTYYTNAKFSATSSSPSSPVGTFSVEEPTSIDLATGTVTVTVTGLDAVGLGVNRAWLVVADVGGVVKTVNVSGCTSTPGACSVSVDLPALAAATSAISDAAGVYEFSVRYWNTSSSDSAVVGGSMRWARAASSVNLRSATTGTVAITVP